MSHSLQSVRDALVLARAGQYISDAEFILLYEQFSMDSWDEKE